MGPIMCKLNIINITRILSGGVYSARLKKELTLTARAQCGVLRRTGKKERRKDLGYRNWPDTDCFTTWLSLRMKVLHTGCTSEALNGDSSAGTHSWKVYSRSRKTSEHIRVPHSIYCVFGQGEGGKNSLSKRISERHRATDA